VDFGEVDDDKYFVIADVSRHKTNVSWRKLENIRPFIDRQVILDSPDDVTDILKSALPPVAMLEGAIIRLSVDYPREWDTLIDDSAMRKYAGMAFEFHLVKHPQINARIRLSADKEVSSLGPLELLDQYWSAGQIDINEAALLSRLAKEIIEEE
jgi:exonuclease SbcD